jgi:hypothetical protein
MLMENLPVFSFSAVQVVGCTNITTPKLEKLGNEDLVQGPSDIPKISKYG